MDDGAWLRIWGFVAFVWTVFSIIFPFIVLAALYSMNKALTELARKHDQMATQIAQLARSVEKSLPTPAPAPPIAASFEQPPVTEIVAGSVLGQVLADPETRKVALSMRRVYGTTVAVDVVKRKAVELGLGELQITEDELNAALQAELPALPPTA